MAELLAVPLKKASEVDLVQPLTNLIRSSFSTADQPEDYSAEIKELAELRNAATRYGYSKPETSLEFMNRYYDQLVILEQKLPVNEVQIPFKWKDAFDRGTIFGGRVRLTISSLAFERICILFNIAATQSIIAEKQSIDNDDELKAAAKYLQQAAGIFRQLRESVLTAIHQEPTPDLSGEVLTALESLMLAQAQEIFTRKAIRDAMKDVVIAKLCAQCEDMYADTLKVFLRDAVRHLWDKDWIALIAGKQAAFQALSQYYQAQVCKAAKNVGEEIARLEVAHEQWKVAQSKSGKPNLFGEFGPKIVKQLNDGKRDNDFIYHAHIPDAQSLSTIAKATLAKPTPMPDKFYPNGKDLFERLCPVVVHQALATFDVRKGEIVNAEIAQLRDATNFLNSTLASLNLPAAIEQTKGDELPQSIIEKNEAIINAGGMKALQDMINELPELLQRNKDILDEADRMLNEEKETDDQLRAQFKEKWNRTPSEKLTETFRSNASKYRQIINNAIQADETVRANFESHRKGMELLSLPKDQLRKAVPLGSSTPANQHSNVLETLRNLMEEVATMKAEREVIESEFKSTTFDMKAQFLHALQKDGAIAEPALSTEALGHGLGPLRKQRERSCEEQNTLIARIQSAHAEWTKDNAQGPSKRDEILKSLTSAYDAFMKLQGDLKEGSKFYNELTQLLVVFQNKISDYCFARRTEKEELLKELTRDACKDTPSLISIPAHHVQTAKQPPPRPPPPTMPSGSNPQIPYPTAPYQGMPMPYGTLPNTPYPSYAPPPMPQGYNPYGTMPYPPQPQIHSGYPYPTNQPYPGYPPQQPPHGTW